MLETSLEHPLSYRQEVVASLFQLIRARDSSAIVSPGSTGKSNLLRFVLQPHVQQHYLGDQASSTLLVLADGNRLAEISDWGLYELLLTALIEVSGQHPDTQSLRVELNALRRDVITSRDAILARRHVELAVHMLCQEHHLTLCLILDEFDESYRSLPALSLANLRALRDGNKRQLCYILVLREHPARLRHPAECEGFYELFSRSILGLGPYTAEDAKRVVEQLEMRKARQLPPSVRTQLLWMSGGHPGLIVTLFDAFLGQESDEARDWITWALEQATIQEECYKLWGSLVDDERLALSHLAQGLDVADDGYRMLQFKGLVQSATGTKTFFSPLFAHFVLTQGVLVSKPLWVNEAASVVWLGGRPVKGLTAREFDLLAFLYRHVGEVCTREQILAQLYPHETHDHDAELQDNRVDTLIKRIREKIEPNRQRPRYVLTVRGKGYKLVDTPHSYP